MVIEPRTREGSRKALPSRTLITVLLLVSGTALGLAGVDLVLPALPELPTELGGTPTEAQLTLSAYVAGTSVGLLLSGALVAFVPVRWLLLGALVALAGTSLTCSLVPGIGDLNIVRFFQGVASATPAVIAPGVLRRLLGSAAAVRALGALSSVEALVPALAPVAGAGLVLKWGWNAPFVAMAIAAGVGAVATLLLRSSIPGPANRHKSGGYRALLANPNYLRQAFSHALTLGGLLVFVFGAPAVITLHLDGSITDFLVMQATGVVTFIIAANLSAGAAKRWGTRYVVVGGSALAVVGALALLGYAFSGGSEPLQLIPLLVPVNIGLGLRGPTGFMLALDAAGDDDRGSALIVLLHTGSAAAGNALVAALIAGGLITLTSVSAFMLVTAFVLVVTARLPDTRGTAHGTA